MPNPTFLVADENGDAAFDRDGTVITFELLDEATQRCCEEASKTPGISFGVYELIRTAIAPVGSVKIQNMKGSNNAA